MSTLLSASRPTTISALVSALIMLGVTGCRESDPPSDHPHSTAAASSSKTYAGPGPIQALCTTGQVADLVQRIGGPQVTVVALMGAGVDPHLYKPTRSDVEKFGNADIIFYNGLHLEGRLTDLLENTAANKPTFAVTAGLVEGSDPRLRKTPDFDGYYDPHAWHDASLWIECARYVGDRLEQFDPPHAEEYAARREEVEKALQSLHESALQRLAGIPKEQRMLVTAHDAFGYFGRAYDIDVRGLQGISTVSEPDVAAMEALVDLLVTRKVKAVFVESSVSSRGVEALIEACRGRGHAVTVGGQLFSDAMGNPGTAEETFEGMFKHNVATIVSALQ